MNKYSIGLCSIGSTVYGNWALVGGKGEAVQPSLTPSCTYPTFVNRHAELYNLQIFFEGGLFNGSKIFT